ncbi:MICOS complex subunit MIC60-1-like isoform X1 [Dreissena polymorpha]|uniref:MICOS complex subunit MIC60-1-like isoform X1 n=1 Tax=Dreissena polymorpha TaxID=45954 RepID=UPI0022656622|nr:MICOS complex subunit MIC60-1-like isoform X1 [Dreissena polymorpha]
MWKTRTFCSSARLRGLGSSSTPSICLSTPKSSTKQHLPVTFAARGSLNIENAFLLGQYRIMALTSRYLTTKVPPEFVKAEKPSPPPPPPPPRKSGFGKKFLFGIVVGSVLVVFGVREYSKYDDKFARKVRSYLDDQLSDGWKTTAGYIFLDSPSVPAPVISGDKTRQDIPTYQPGTYQETDKNGNLLPKLRTAPVPLIPETAPAAEKDAEVDRKLREKAELQQQVLEKEASVAARNQYLQERLADMETDCREAWERAAEAQQRALEATRRHTQLMRVAMDDTTNVQEKDLQWQNVAMAFDEREDAARKLDIDLSNARDNLDRLKHAIDEGRKEAETKKNAALTTANEKLNKWTSELNKKQNEVSRAESEYRVMMKYKDLVDKGKEVFRKEVESLMPELGTKIRSGRKMSEEDLNILIAHAHRRIEQLNKQMALQLAMENQRLQQALSDQRDEDEKITQARIQVEQERMRDEFAIQKERWVGIVRMREEFAIQKERWEKDANVEFELELRKELSRQTAAHSDHLQQVLRIQETKLVREFERELHVRMLDERQRFEGELSGWTARLRGIESAVSARAESEAIAKEAQDLWLATVALNGSILYGNEGGKTWEEQLKPLEKDVETIFMAAKNNPFVNRVLESIPQRALTRGVYTEDNLRQRFTKVYRVAKRVALIDETGGSLMKFMLSYFQSFFVIPSVYAIHESDEVDVSKMDVFQLCGHARYWIEKGDLEQALKFMNQLTGESRRVAADWIEETRLLLETKQAALALMAFASSSGLGTIF